MFATEFPWLDEANTQVIIFENPNVDIASRITAIRSATGPITSIVYGRGIGPRVGLPLIKAFRAAHNSGLPGRYIHDRVGSFQEDRGNKSWMYLADSKLTNPPQVIDFGGLKNYLHGLNLTDMVHIKILVINEGTPDEMIWFGGRNDTEDELTNLDLSMLIRRIDPNKPYLGDQIRSIVEEVWSDVNHHYKPRIPLPLGFMVKGEDDPQKDIEQLLDTEDARREFQAVQKLLARKPLPTDELESFEARPEKARAVTNSFLGLLRTKIFGRSFNSRENLYSEIHESMAPYIEKAKDIYLTSMIFFLSPTLKKAVRKALENEAEVLSFMNGVKAHESRVPWGVSFLQSVPDVLELMNVSGKFSAIALDLQKTKEAASAYVFAHRKALVADEFVNTGSDNNNDTSRTRNYEFAAQFLDKRLSMLIRGILKRDQRLYSALSCEIILTQRKAFGWVRRGLNWILRPLY